MSLEYETFEELTEQQRMERRAQRTKLRRERQRRERMRRLRIMIPVAALAVALLVFFLVRGAKHREKPAPEPEVAQTVAPEEPEETLSPLSVRHDGAIRSPGENVTSTYAVLIDAETGQVLVSRSGDVVINPASMTKILTLLTAADHVTDVHQAITFTQEMSDYAFVSGLSIAGFLPGEKVTVEDLLYGTILPSGADAALGLAIFCSGSEEAFVEEMNAKAAQLGLSRYAHFTNCAGTYGENHHCTAEDMAVILKSAMDHELFRQVLSAHTYTTSLTTEHPEGIPLSNWFLRRIEDKDTGAITVVGAKTGYVNEAGSCAASYGQTADGHGYLCVTADAQSAWRCIYDHVALYHDFIS